MTFNFIETLEDLNLGPHNGMRHKNQEWEKEKYPFILINIVEGE